MRRRRFQLAAALVLAVVVAVAFATVALSRGGSASSIRPNVTDPSQAISAIDPGRNQVLSTTSVGRYPALIASDRDALWVANIQDETITRIDPRTHLAAHTFAPGPLFIYMAAFGGSMWVAAPEANRVLRLDGSTDEVSARITTPGPHAFVASGGGQMWLGGEGAFWSFDPATGRHTVVFVPHRSAIAQLQRLAPGPLAILGGRMFLDERGVNVLRFDPAGDVITESQRYDRFGDDDSRMAVGRGFLWVTSTQADELLRVDPNSLDVALRVSVGSRPIGVAYGAGSIWVANSADGTVMRIDPASGRILATIHVGGAPYAMAFTHGLAWVTLL